MALHRAQCSRFSYIFYLPPSNVCLVIRAGRSVNSEVIAVQGFATNVFTEPTAVCCLLPCGEASYSNLFTRFILPCGSHPKKSIAGDTLDQTLRIAPQDTDDFSREKMRLALRQP
jgi:hypothetical protein